MRAIPTDHQPPRTKRLFDGWFATLTLGFLPVCPNVTWAQSEALDVESALALALVAQDRDQRLSTSWALAVAPQEVL